MYNVREVTDNLYWVGANDHRTHLFENIHPIPYGVSYNAYLLMDEETVLFDTVDWSAYRQLEENLDFLLGDKPLDVIVVNHMEPDHAASLQAVLDKYPKAKVISTARAFTMMGQYGFSTEGHETETVKEFFAAVSYSAAMNLHIKEFYGENTHHVIEAMFKSFARALSEAVSFDPRITDVLSTKGSL